MPEQLSNLIDLSNGYRKMLERIFHQFGNVAVSDEIILRIQNGTADNGYLFNKITNGLGVSKSHCSGKYPRHEDELRHGGKNGARRDSIKRNH